MAGKSKATAEVKYDGENDVLYIQLSGAEVARTEALDDLRLVDYEASGQPAGIEFISASDGLDLRDLPFAKQIEDALAREDLHFIVLV